MAGFPATVAIVQDVRAVTKAAFRMSQVGLNLIAEVESFEARAYHCPAGHATIGYGHLLHKGACTPDDLKLEWTKAHALEVLAHDVKVAEEAVKKYITAPISQPMFDALVSFTYNLGGGTLAESTLRERLNSGDVIDAALQFPRFIYADGKKSKGLLRRRLREAQLFLA